MPKNRVLTSLLPCFKVKGKGQGQGQMSGFWVEVKGQGQISGAQRSAAKSNRSHYQSKVFVCNRGAYTDNSADVVDRLLIYKGWKWNV